MQKQAVFRPWPTLWLAGIALLGDSSFLSMQIIAAMTGAGTWSNVRLTIPALVVGGWLGWMMTNRLVLTPDQLSSRYLWQIHTIRRADIDYVHDIRPVGNATSVALVLKNERAVALTWSGAAAHALIDWIKDVPRQETAETDTPRRPSEEFDA